MPDGSPLPLPEGLVARVPGARSAVLAETHGLMIAGHGLGRDHGDALSATVCVMFTSAREASVRLGGRDGVRQVVVDGKDFLLHAVSAGTAILAVLAGAETDVGLLGDEMRRVAEEIRPWGTAGGR